jgi:DNA-binding IclR family transcriptional regulator
MTATADGQSTGAGTTIASIERAADVLLYLASTGTPDLGVTEVASALDLSKAVVHRILSSLRHHGFVRVDPDTRRYSLGPAALTIGAAYLDNMDIRDLAAEPMRRLVKLTGETATLSIRDGWTRVYIDQMTPPREVKMSVRLGVPFPLHAGGSSKAFLAFLPDDEIDRYLDQPDLAGLTSETVTDAAALRREITEIRKRGYATSFGERQSGAASAAAPVFDRRGEPIAVVSVSGPVERYRPHVESAAEHLLAETAELSRLMGWRPTA